MNSCQYSSFQRTLQAQGGLDFDLAKSDINCRGSSISNYNMDNCVSVLHGILEFDITLVLNIPATQVYAWFKVTANNSSSALEIYSFDKEFSIPSFTCRFKTHVNLKYDFRKSLKTEINTFIGGVNELSIGDITNLDLEDKVLKVVQDACVQAKTYIKEGLNESIQKVTNDAVTAMNNIVPGTASLSKTFKSGGKSMSDLVSEIASKQIDNVGTSSDQASLASLITEKLNSAAIDQVGKFTSELANISQV